MQLNSDETDEQDRCQHRNQHRHPEQPQQENSQSGRSRQQQRDRWAGIHGKSQQHSGQPRRSHQPDSQKPSIRGGSLGCSGIRRPTTSLLPSARHRYQRPNGLKGPRPDAGHVLNVFNRGEGAVGIAMGNDSPRHYRTDVGEGLQFLRRGGIEVDQRDGKATALSRRLCI